MTIVNKKDLRRKPEIDLSGPAGNAFSLMGEAMKLSKMLGKDGKSIVEKMMSGDYKNLINIFDREFGEYVDLIR